MSNRQAVCPLEMAYYVKWRLDGSSSRRPVAKTFRELEPVLPGIVPPEPDRQLAAAHQAFHVKRRLTPWDPVEVTTYFHCHRKIDLVRVFSALMLTFRASDSVRYWEAKGELTTIALGLVVGLVFLQLQFKLTPDCIHIFNKALKARVYVFSNFNPPDGLLRQQFYLQIAAQSTRNHREAYIIYNLSCFKHVLHKAAFILCAIQ